MKKRYTLSSPRTHRGLLSLATLSALAGLSDGAWTFPNFSFPSGGSGAFTITPAGNAGDPTNLNNDFSFDRPPTPMTLSWSSTNNEPISFSLVPFVSGSTSINNAWIEVNLDADNDDVLPDVLGVTLDFSYPITIKSPGPTNSGGFGMAVNTVGSQADITLGVFDGTLSQVPLDSTFGYYTATAVPTSYLPDGTAVFSGVSNDSSNAFDQTGLAGRGTSITRFPFDNGPSPDPANGIGRQVWTFENIRGGSETFRFSYDGGLPINSVATIPEPSTTLLCSVVLSIFAFHRRRSVGVFGTRG